MGERKQANYMGDFFHWAALVGEQIAPGAGDLRKIDARPALRAAMVAQEMGRFEHFHHPAYRARWGEARDLSQREVLAELLDGAGLDAGAALERAESDEINALLDQRTREAVDRGVFGVPTMFVGDEMFWGNDRFEVVRFYIERSR
jgi:2-hydroxychromene-2-carboxylate isomerase